MARWTKYNYKNLGPTYSKRACQWAVNKQGIKDVGIPWSKNDNRGSYQRLWVAIGSGRFYMQGGKYKIARGHIDYPAAWCQYFCNASYIIGRGGSYYSWMTTGSTKEMVARAKARGVHTTNLRSARPGDWIYMGRNVPANRGSYHVELVIANNFVGSRGNNGHLITIGGNSAPPPGSREKRDGVYKHRRDYGYLINSGHAIVKPWNY